MTKTSLAVFLAAATAGGGSGGGPLLAAANTFPYAEPTFRFEPFHLLDETSQNIAEERLGYLEVTWNVHGLAPVERDGWNALTTNEREAAGLLGFTESTWDCFINHYEDNDWDSLEALGVHVHYMGLGWTRAHWEGLTDDVPHTESRWWNGLTDNEKRAANALCYFEDNWDKNDMNPNDSYFPHQMPSFRYKPWGELDAVTENVASGMLNYTEGLWDYLGTSVAEKNTFLNLDGDERAGALELGFYTHTWDCFMNHYLSYYWSSFHGDLLVAVEALGWTEEMWTGEAGVYPASEEKMWGSLSPEERAAATRLCYFQETWDEEPIIKWYDYDNDVVTAATGEGPVPENVNLGIFKESGYAGRDPKVVGTASASSSSPGTTAGAAEKGTASGATSLRGLVSSGLTAVALSLGAYLLV